MPTKTDTWPVYLTDMAVATCLLTRLPVPTLPSKAFERSAAASWAFPVVGLLVGAIGAATGFLALKADLPATVAAGLVLAVFMIVTGAMHEDGLADTADGFWGGGSRERRLDIMKDSQIGTYGTLSLLIVVGLRWTAYAMILPVALPTVIAVAAASRATLPGMMHALPNARENGLSHNIGQPAFSSAIFALALGLGLGVLSGGYVAIAVFAASCCAAVATAWVARRKIGGQTGDVLGAAQQLAECAGLLTLLAVI